MTNREFFIRRWEQEFPAFLQVFKSLPADRLDYRPEPRARSAGELLTLLVEMERTGIELCEKGEIHWQEPRGVGKRDEMVADYEHTHQAVGERLRRLDEAAWSKVAQCWEHGHVEIEDSVGGLFWLYLFDAVHHRGQLSTYIRPMGGKVPSIYGPSADEPSTKCIPVGLGSKMAR